jgi:uncharacterized BrkB/YihY/UPF0761 family membrane protein
LGRQERDIYSSDARRSFMKKRARNLLAVGGVMGMVFGVLLAIPSYLQGKLAVAAIAGVLIVVGIVLLAIAFGEE